MVFDTTHDPSRQRVPWGPFFVQSNETYARAHINQDALGREAGLAFGGGLGGPTGLSGGGGDDDGSTPARKFVIF